MLISSQNITRKKIEISSTMRPPFSLGLTYNFVLIVKSFLVLNNDDPFDRSYSNSNVTSRIINPMETDPIYPWMAFLLRQEREKPNKQEDSIPETCTGAVLSRRAIITAGHCVCSQKIKDKELYPECLLNSGKENPQNQIIPGRDIFYVVGKQVVDDRLLSEDQYGEVLYDLPKAQKAFAYSTKTTEGESKVIDIGLLIVDIPRWEILTSVNPMEHDAVRPIDLPDEGMKSLHNKNVHVAGWGQRFDFGYHDRGMKQEGTYDHPTKYSSCMTTSESPVASQFQRCDTIEIINNEKNPSNQGNIARDTICHSEYPLDWMELNGIPNQLGKEDECNAYWKAANDVVFPELDIVVQRQFKAAHRIKVNGKYCYRSELWRNKGWCKLADYRKWGFCSSSCNLQFIKDPETKKYLATEMHIIEKSSDQKTLCGWTKKMQRKFNNAHICAIPTYPNTKTLVFKEDFRAKGDLPIFVKDDPTIEPEDFTTPKRGYSGICRGDSGAPLWIADIVRSPIKNQPCYKKNTLVGVMSGAINSINQFEPPCSSFASRAHKITKEVLAWIRKNMQRYDSE